MDSQLLVNEQIEAGAEFIREFDDTYAVSVACWIKPADSERTKLYIASDEIDHDTMSDAYGMVLRQLKRSQWLDPFQIKLINTSDPVARDAIEIRNLYDIKVPTPYDGIYLGGMGIDGAYIYPDISAMKSAP